MLPTLSSLKLTNTLQTKKYGKFLKYLRILGQRPTLRAALLLAKFLPSFQITVGRATGNRFDPGCG